MLDIIAPQVHPDRDALLLKDLLELPGGIGLFPSALTAADDRFPAAVEVHIGVIGGEVGHIVHGGVLVDHLVHVIAKAVFCGVDAAEGQTTIEKIGEPQVEVDGMGRAQAAAKGDHAGEAVPAVALLGDILDLGHNFLHDVADPLLIAADPPVGVAVGVGPGLLIDGVDGDDHDLPGFDPRSQRTGHVEVLKVEETAILTGDKEHRAACVAVDLALHLPAQCGAVILEVLCFHLVSLLYKKPLRRSAPLLPGEVASRRDDGEVQSSSYISVWNTNGSCFSQLASLWVPPGTRRLVRWMPRTMILLHISANSLRIPSWLPISWEP